MFSIENLLGTTHAHKDKDETRNSSPAKEEQARLGDKRASLSESCTEIEDSDKDSLGGRSRCGGSLHFACT